MQVNDSNKLFVSNEDQYSHFHLSQDCVASLRPLSSVRVNNSVPSLIYLVDIYISSSIITASCLCCRTDAYRFTKLTLNWFQ
ncbi:hypothetical protein CEXT_811471 [Caerostris extrusa]|uniref:Uncharacterized protein n=1 Tax=Caerostris extrusa TaxID=172846 RepID=A0AAV4TET6_CAEEX|nr:hypothetical protein CEXT_811471 [Caerostris extrusa]